MTTLDTLHIIGGGLAGCEAAWQSARRGVPAVIHEMRPEQNTDAHVTDNLAELVCSNSFRSDDSANNAVGLLHEEMRRTGSLILRSADDHRVPAGSALAVDRVGFSEAIERTLEAEPLIEIDRREVSGLPPESWSSVIVATGPLTSPGLAAAIQNLTGEDALAFFDAISPIVYRDSIDFSKAWYQSRYDKGEKDSQGDYINCPLNKAQYEALIAGLLGADKIEFKEWEAITPYFEGCLPIEVMAERGLETLRYGPMKPVGLTNPHNTEQPYAVVQLRQDNSLGTLYNIVGFQTKLRYGEQRRLFRNIPGLENAEFARLGGVHRNTFINSPKLLDREFRLAAMPRMRFAGQITGVEGYVECAAVGLLAGRFAAAEILGETTVPLPATTALGALRDHITGGANAGTFQPMNVNFGLFPPLNTRVKKRERKPALTARALADLDTWLRTAYVAAE
ncbi:MAG: methylenetetrahydrofolate--tRNA-(uracil(54)-C(5))-methyltransferase (FADH(2)-oxidizing) TrmFO [Alphaproteobacteria bacterium]|nr:methylenetetrahydrofolate--tRNA-(uracil(54)-C(5))-methyltransferase (FADH(2)-oxidizing) TrmFO [Alphaproteobacteria bacterium]